MSEITPDSWRALPARADVYAELIAEPVTGLDGTFLAVDHEGTRHLLFVMGEDTDPVSDERSRGIRALTRQLAVAGEPEQSFVDLLCPSGTEWHVFDLVATAIIEQIEQGADAADAVRGTLARWRRFWAASPESGLTRQEVRGLFGELWFLSAWLLPRGLNQLPHWLGPTGARHDFQWPGLAVESKTTTSVRGHVHRVNGLDQLTPPPGGRLLLFSLRVREEATASDSLVSLVEGISKTLAADADVLGAFETLLMQTGYSPAHAERYSEIRFRILNERLYEVTDGFPRLSVESFVGAVPDGIERIEYDVNLDSCPDLVCASSAIEFEPPA